MEVTEQELLELIKTQWNVVVKMWSDNCPFCKKQDPIFIEAAKRVPSHKYVSFKIDYMNPNIQDRALELMYKKAELGKKGGVPAILVFHDGKLLYKHHGFLEKEAFEKFVDTGEEPIKKVDPKAPIKQSLMNSFAQKGELIHLWEKMQNQLKGISEKIEEINKNIFELEKQLEAGA